MDSQDFRSNRASPEYFDSFPCRPQEPTADDIKHLTVPTKGAALLVWLQNRDVCVYWHEGAEHLCINGIALKLTLENWRSAQDLVKAICRMDPKEYAIYSRQSLPRILNELKA